MKNLIYYSKGFEARTCCHKYWIMPGLDGIRHYFFAKIPDSHRGDLYADVQNNDGTKNFRKKLLHFQQSVDSVSSFTAKFGSVSIIIPFSK